VHLVGDLDVMSPTVAAATFRLAQESVTNAMRHARNATRIDVRVSGDGEVLRLTVVDDGDVVASDRISWGYGIVGMTERATLLGGSLTAGPGRERGWSVQAVLPRAGAAS
jgi:signal transduction histidine kinase